MTICRSSCCDESAQRRIDEEFAFRYDARKVSNSERAAQIVAGAEGKRLTYLGPKSALAQSPLT